MLPITAHLWGAELSRPLLREFRVRRHSFLSAVVFMASTIGYSVSISVNGLQCN